MNVLSRSEMNNRTGKLFFLCCSRDVTKCRKCVGNPIYTENILPLYPSWCEKILLEFATSRAILSPLNDVILFAKHNVTKMHELAHMTHIGICDSRFQNTRTHPRRSHLILTGRMHFNRSRHLLPCSQDSMRGRDQTCISSKWLQQAGCTEAGEILDDGKTSFRPNFSDYANLLMLEIAWAINY